MSALFIPSELRTPICSEILASWSWSTQSSICGTNLHEGPFLLIPPSHFLSSSSRCREAAEREKAVVQVVVSGPSAARLTGRLASDVKYCMKILKKILLPHEIQQDKMLHGNMCKCSDGLWGFTCENCKGKIQIQGWNLKKNFTYLFWSVQGWSMKWVISFFMKYLFSRYKSAVTLSQLAIVLSPIRANLCNFAQTWPESEVPPSHPRKTARVSGQQSIYVWDPPLVGGKAWYNMWRDETQNFSRQNNDNGHQNFNAHNVNVNDNIWSECQ